MVLGYVGRPGSAAGSGKTYSAVEMLLKFYRRRGEQREVFSNTPLRGIRFSYLPNWEEFLKVHTGIVLLDELGVWASSRDFQSLPWGVRAMLAQHRHQGIDLVYTAQNINRVDTIIREITTHIYVCVKMGLHIVRWKMDPLNPETKLGANATIMKKNIWKAYDTTWLVSDPTGKSRFAEGVGKLWQENAPVAIRGCKRVCDCGEKPCWCNNWHYKRTDENRGIFIPLENEYA